MLVSSSKQFGRPGIEQQPVIYDVPIKDADLRRLGGK